MIPVSIHLELLTDNPRIVESTALTRGAEIFDADPSELEVTYLSDGQAIDTLQSTWRFTATVTWTFKEPF